MKIKRSFVRDQKIAKIPSNIQLLAQYKQLLKEGEMKQDDALETLLKKRPIRSQSWIVSVQVLTKPYRCPGKCIFCPNDFTMPKSYINTEPGAMRALLNNFDPIKQVYNRLLSLTLTGHKIDKVEMIVLWGTRDVYPEEYKEAFIKGLYNACNTFPLFYDNVTLKQDQTRALKYTIKDYDISYPKTLEESQNINETWASRIVGLTVETRPEYVTDDNCRFWRRLWVTRLEMGIQSSNDEVLKANKRGHDHVCSRMAVHKLRQYGFKMSVHLMPGLYGSDNEKDLQTFVDVFSEPHIKPDEIKFYPTAVIPNTELYDLYREGKYKPLETETIKQLIRSVFLDIIPPYTRIKRLIRDIPSTEIVAGSNVTNLSQLTHQELKKKLAWTKDIQKLYGRLYQWLESYASLDDYLLEQQHREKLTPSSLITSVIWSQPDQESYRNFVSIDTRSREIRHKFDKQKGLPQVTAHQGKTSEALLVMRKYLSSVWTEYFISFEDELGYLYGFTRLMLPLKEEAMDWDGLGADHAQIRELHVYGKVEGIKKSKQDQMNVKKTQHTGFGKRLMQTAEKISQNAGYPFLSVIAGIGVKTYYEKLWYEREGTYVVKSLS